MSKPITVCPRSAQGCKNGRIFWALNTLTNRYEPEACINCGHPLPRKPMPGKQAGNGSTKGVARVKGERI